MDLQILGCLVGNLDDVFEDFYQRMLSNQDFAVFFRDDAQVRNLIGKQKQYFIRSLTSTREELRKTYIILGEYHYDLKLPFVDFSAAMTMMEERILSISAEKPAPQLVIEAVFNFFRLVRGFTAQGYLNRMLETDTRDIDLYLENVRKSTEVDIQFATERILWLQQLLHAIKTEDRGAAPPLALPPQILSSINEAVEDDAALQHYITETLSRIEIDAANVFYFIEKQSYEEVLSLYRELTNIYKLSLMLTNVITIASSNSLIGSLARDGLTGLLTRTSLETIIGRELTIASSSGYAISLIVLDIDYFKSINDNYGHNAGDEVLRKVAKIIQESIRATDFAFRYGGEEFLVVLKGASEKICFNQAEHIRREIAKTTFTFAGTSVAVTASFGIATFLPPFLRSFSGMFKDADEKLYQSKYAGRNRTTS